MPLPTKPCRHCFGSGHEINQLEFGSLMRALRLAAKKSLTAVAFEMDISLSYLSDLELGRRAWNGELVASFHAAINYTPKIKKGKQCHA